jgi:glycosyltransferase involved in cell wall biosynthesis
MKCPAVSIVTPSLNQGQFIEQAIQSVRGQDYLDLEHIIVDGGSTDCTTQTLKKYEKAYNMRWISEPDNGMYEAINKGMRRARGQILAYLNADDLYFPWTVRAVVEAFQDQPSVDLVYGDMVSMAMDGRYASIIFSPPEEILRTHLRFFSLAQPSVFWRRRVFESLKGFDESLHIASDYDFWLKASRRFRFRKLNEVLAVFRFHSKSKSLKNLRSSWEENTRARARYYGPKTLSATAHRALYEVLWGRYHSTRLLTLWARRLSKGKQAEEWKHFLGARGVSVIPLRKLCSLSLFFIPLFPYAIVRRNPDFAEGYFESRPLLEVALARAASRRRTL